MFNADYSALGFFYYLIVLEYVIFLEEDQITYIGVDVLQYCYVQWLSEMSERKELAYQIT